MALPTTPANVEQMAGLTNLLFNLADQSSLDALVTVCITRADAWMQGHMGGNYNLLTPAWAPILQEEGQIYLALEKLSAILRSQKVTGTHFAFVSEDSGAYQNLIETDWGERAIAALDLWVTVEVAATRAFAMPVFSATPGVGPADFADDTTFDSISQQYSNELDWARGVVNGDIGTVTR